MFRRAAMVFVWFVVVGPVAVSAQDRTLDPWYGTLKLQSGFEPVVIDLLAGGPVSAYEEIGGSCVGHIAEAPDLVVTFTASGDSPLTFSVSSNNDTTLIVADPVGNLICDDDSAGNFNPLVVIDNPVSGAYAVWVGTYYVGRYEDATLTVAGAQPVAAALNWDLDPQFGQTELVAGFLPDPFWVDVAAGGAVDMSSVGSQCWGFAGAEPDYRLFFEAGQDPLTFYVMSEADTTIAIADPDGNWICNDDTNGLNPQVTFDPAVTGQYDIWVGTFSAGGEQAATLFITELGGPDDDVDGSNAAVGTIDPGLPPTFGTLALESGFLPDPFTAQLTAGGDFYAYDIDQSCVGYLDEAPNFRLTYQAGIFPLYVWAESAVDTTLVILDPNGTWLCDDDGAAIPLDPAIAIGEPVSGDYLIWVGTYGGTNANATLFISEVTDGREGAADADAPASGASGPDTPSAPAASGVSGNEPASGNPMALPDGPVFMD